MESRATVTFNMELFVNIFDSLHSLTTVVKIFILDVAGVLDPTLITDIFASLELDLNPLQPVVAFLYPLKTSENL